MTLVVFGGTGFVGSAIINELRQKEKIISISSKSKSI